MKFSSRTYWPPGDNEISRIHSLLKQDAAPILDLTVSNPTRCGFHYFENKLLNAFDHPQNLNYDPDPKGLMPAREIIAQYYKQRGIEVNPQNIFITANTSEAYSFIFKLLFNPEDFLLAPQPSYPLLDYLAALNDISIKRYSLDPSKKWSIDLSGHYEGAEINPKAVLTVNPNNPTGNYLTTADLAELNLYCKNREAAIISDEVFFDFPIAAEIPQDAASCAGNQHTLTFTLSGISKVLGLPQMKLSWIVVSGPPALTQEAVRRLEIISDTYLSVSTPTQNALGVWFRQLTSIQDEILQRIRKNHQTMQNCLGSNGTIRLFPVQGGWHAPLQASASKSDEEWACELLKKYRVLTHPGYLFDFPEGSYLTVSLITPEHDFSEGMRFIKKLTNES